MSPAKPPSPPSNDIIDRLLFWKLSRSGTDSRIHDGSTLWSPLGQRHGGKKCTPGNFKKFVKRELCPLLTVSPSMVRTTITCSQQIAISWLKWRLMDCQGTVSLCSASNSFLPDLGLSPIVWSRVRRLASLTVKRLPALFLRAGSSYESYSIQQRTEVL